MNTRMTKIRKPPERCVPLRTASQTLWAPRIVPCCRSPTRPQTPGVAVHRSTAECTDPDAFRSSPASGGPRGCSRCVWHSRAGTRGRNRSGSTPGGRCTARPTCGTCGVYGPDTDRRVLKRALGLCIHRAFPIGPTEPKPPASCPSPPIPTHLLHSNDCTPSCQRFTANHPI